MCDLCDKIFDIFQIFTMLNDNFLGSVLILEVFLGWWWMIEFLKKTNLKNYTETQYIFRILKIPVHLSCKRRMNVIIIIIMDVGIWKLTLINFCNWHYFSAFMNTFQMWSFFMNTFKMWSFFMNTYKMWSLWRIF